MAWAAELVEGLRRNGQRGDRLGRGESPMKRWLVMKKRAVSWLEESGKKTEAKTKP